MKKNTKFIFGITFLAVLLILLVFNPKGLLLSPGITPADYLLSKPYMELFGVIIIVPSSTLIVYLLGLQIIFLGYIFHKKGLTLWGISFIFWGVGTILAGTSYQGLGYELKCNGTDLCRFTSWFELSYLFVTAISISIMALAFSKQFIKKTNNPLELYAKVALGVYTSILIIGTVIENEFMISYELFTLFFMPLFLVFFIINILNYKKYKLEEDKVFIILWILFLIVNVLYYAYYIPGITETLYSSTGIWFSANDVLHVGLIGWFLYIQIIIKKHLIKS